MTTMFLESSVATLAVPSPNHGERRDGRSPDMVILHYTGMPDEDDALRRLCDPASQVSAHYFVFEDGRVAQMVPEMRRAWHAGASFWQGERDINSISLGIEIVNPGHAGGSPPFGRAQIASTIALVQDLAARWSIRPERILAHSDIAPTRKCDPGEAFPWHELARTGIGHWVEPEPLTKGPWLRLGDANHDVHEVQILFDRYGYEVLVSGIFDDQTQAVVKAFQRHFRPQQVDGIVDVSTRVTLQRLSETLPPQG